MFMITLFENFQNGINIRDYIKKEKGIYKIPSYDFYNFDVNNKEPKPKYYAKIKYNSLMRFYLYFKFLDYNGNNNVILNCIKGLVDKDQDIIEVINKIPNNRHVLDMVNSKFNLDYSSYSYDNLQGLKKLVDNYQVVLSDQNLIEYLKEVKTVSDSAKQSERIVKSVINMMYGRFFNIESPDVSEDLKGVDLWMIEKETGDKKAIQIKNVTTNFNLLGYVIYIDNTGIDLHEYNPFNGDVLPYDYLAFYLPKKQQVCIIKSTAILAIDRPSARQIKIKLKRWAFEYKSTFRMIDVPKKFLPPDYSKIFY